jgi:hypothetical protein
MYFWALQQIGEFGLSHLIGSFAFCSVIDENAR